MVQWFKVGGAFTALVLLLAGLAASLGAAESAQAQGRTRCFDATGFCVSDPILGYWERNGGLEVFGYPIGEQQEAEIEGVRLQAQWFERDRLEIQLDGGITAGRLGARLLELRGTPWRTFATVDSTVPTGCIYFEATQHSLCEPFLSYWLNNGGLERFGYPITETMRERLEGNVYDVQYFERRRMEHHTNLPGSPVLLGLLGRTVLSVEEHIISPTGCTQPVAVPPELSDELAPGTYLNTRLGCPLGVFQLNQVAEQYFERGVMLYADLFEEEGNEYIYVVTTDPLPVTFQRYEDTWTSDEPETGGETPPEGLIEPKRGFGKVWREQPGVREALGWATMQERPATGVYAAFEGGELIWLNDTDFLYVFFNQMTPEGNATARPRAW
jgi:hypothetical protein